MGNLKGAITCLETANLKPNFSALGREYGLDRRTAKKKYLGITNKKKRKKESKLDKHQDLIKTKLNIPGVNKKAVYEYIIMNIDDNIGSYSTLESMFVNIKIYLFLKNKMFIQGTKQIMASNYSLTGKGQ